MEETNEEVQKQLMKKIKKGIYRTRNLIVPQKYEKEKLKNGQLLDEEIQVFGRKIPLRDIRTTMLKFLTLERKRKKRTFKSERKLLGNYVKCLLNVHWS